MITKDNIEALIKFGGLISYQITVFNPVFWTQHVELRTFNEAYARERYHKLKENGDIVMMESLITKFNNDECQPPKKVKIKKKK